MANAAPATQRLSALQRLAESHTPPAQLRQTISGRQRLSRLARDAIRLIQQSGPAGNNATLAEVQAHDRAMSPGQHHAMRIVRRSDLIRDLVTRRGQHAQNNIRDSTAMNAAERAGNNVLAAQLAAEKTRAPEQ